MRTLGPGPPSCPSPLHPTSHLTPPGHSLPSTVQARTQWQSRALFSTLSTRGNNFSNHSPIQIIQERCEMYMFNRCLFHSPHAQPCNQECCINPGPGSLSAQKELPLAGHFSGRALSNTCPMLDYIHHPLVSPGAGSG